MNEELRDRLEAVLDTVCIPDALMHDHETWNEAVIHAILAEIEAAGFRLVEQERWERVRELGRAAEDYGLSNDLGDWFWDAQDALQPGDLDGDV